MGYTDLSSIRRYPFGTCVKFQRMFELDPPVWGYDAFYHMELDVVPLMRNWLDQLMPIFKQVAANNAWMVGASLEHRCLLYNQTHLPNPSGVIPMSDPLNGNSIYNTLNTSFVQ